ncbi:DUF4275 family protein [Duganella sp. Root1480D1]|uniref:DUF4275 family protein n=1 Tax=Duganella sp. Root1480D1 TaxID=1736471 RepID=UPI0007096A5D|nr:DUF4275 family protein [Duganella sp. Root1480D1]KQZ28192.1 hypothetical protein ASD58_12195 [Duganella sp. Root1480D1]
MPRREHHALVAPGSVLRQLTKAEASRLAEDWLAVFGKMAQGVNTKAYLWHAFSADCYPAISGDEAVGQYRQQAGVEFVVLSNDRKQAFVTDLLPESSSLSDFYVFPSNLAWTMAFTHEDGWLGPLLREASGLREAGSR